MKLLDDEMLAPVVGGHLTLTLPNGETKEVGSENAHVVVKAGNGKDTVEENPGSKTA